MIKDEGWTEPAPDPVKDAAEFERQLMEAVRADSEGAMDVLGWSENEKMRWRARRDEVRSLPVVYPGFQAS